MEKCNNCDVKILELNAIHYFQNTIISLKRMSQKITSRCNYGLPSLWEEIIVH
jgi:hypothetical protein